MAELGIGVRCWIGWAPADKRSPRAAYCCQGVIENGPVPHGSLMPLPWLRSRNLSGFTGWVVRDSDGLQFVAEHLLSPIDDGIEAEPREVEVEA